MADEQTPSEMLQDAPTGSKIPPEVIDAVRQGKTVPDEIEVSGVKLQRGMGLEPGEPSFPGKAGKRKKKANRVMKGVFAVNVLKNQGKLAKAYQETYPGVKPRSAEIAARRLFKDPETQEIFRSYGIDIGYIAQKNKQLMDSANLPVAASIVRQFNKALLQDVSVQRIERTDTKVFMDLTEEKLKHAKRGKIITIE